MASNNVSVAVRIRPKLQKEQIDMCNICTRVSPDEPQVWLGHDKAFTFDYVFDIASHQFDVYDNCVRTLVDGCFEGFNATVLAYGQTGSGKTYTMGTGFDVSSSDDQRGIIPRAVYHLFDSIQSRKEEAKANGLPLPEFNVTAQFIEIYNEELIDLLCEKRRKGLQIRIHEDQKRGIILTGVENKTVSSAEDTLACLKSGSLFRTTGATLMNAESSRSHAIFTLFIKQSRVEHVLNGTDEADSEPQQELVTLTAKFNFVDLAGSERLSRTGAVGERAREGISINSGLLHLGNVISALGDRSKKSSHIPYRDSKLTRVLQDSLGGNSVTTMIACISPCDRDFVETLNTLRYANRAKNIKNKVVANQDSQTQLINELRRQLMQLQVENQELKQGKLFVKNDGELELNDVYLEKEMLQRDLNNANIRIKALNTRLEGLTTENISIRGKMAKLQISNGDAGSDDNESDEDCAGSLIKGYLKEINTLRSKVIESEYTISYYREQLNKQETKELNDQDQPIDIIERAKYEIELGKSRLFHMNSSINSADSNGNRFSEGNDNYDNNGDLSGDEDEVQDEFEKKMADQNAEIATLMEIISSKERLIEEAEAREKRIIELTNHYEQKISSFKSKIKQTEDERDSLISKYKRDNKEDHNSKRLKDDYDRRVAMLQSEVRKYEALKREHDKVLRNESSSKDQLKKLRQEIIETKKKRVQLMGEMRQQMNRHNKEMQKSKLVINKLTREDYKKDVKIRDLVVQSNQQKKLLQRRDEELKVLRRRVKPMSDRVAGRITHVKRNNHGHTPQKARNMWHNFEQKFNELVMLRISFDKEEKKLERYLAERQNNINIINTLKEDHVDGDLNTEYLDNLQVNIDYLSKCIEDSQNMIMQIEEDNFNIEQMFDNCDMSEIMYIVNNLANSAIIYAIRASEKDEELKEKDSKLATLWNENAYSNHLLNYMVSKNFDGEENGVYPPGAINPLVNVDPSLLTPAKSSNDNKFRRLTMTPSELLYQSSAMEAANQTFVAKQLVKVDEDEDYVSSSTNHDGHSSPKSPNGTFVVDKNFDSTFVKETNDQPNVPNDNLVMHQISDRMTQSLHVDHPPVASSNANHLHLNAQPLNRNGVPTDSGDLYRVPSAPSLKDLTNHNSHHHQFTASTPVHQTHHHHSHHHSHHNHNQNSHLLSPRLLRRKIHQQSALMPPPPPPPLNNNIHSASNTANNNSNNVNGSSHTTSASSTNNSNNKARLIRSVSNNGGANSNNNYYNNCNGSATSNGTTTLTSNSTNSANNSNSSTSSSHHQNHHHHHSPNNKAEYNNNTTSNSSATNIPAASNSFPQQPKQYNGHSHYYSQHHQPSPQASPSLSSSRHAFLHDPYTATAAAAANQYNGTPPGSPSINRRLNRDNSNSMASSITQDSDVFSRLTNTSSMTRQPVEYSVGRIEPASSSKGHNDKSFPLVCTHTVVGHRRSVLSVTATNEVLFSGSKDGTARIWDLGQGEEVFSLNDHPDSVNVVRYDEYNKLIFTCSKSIIKIWDPRQKPVNCVHTLCASGLMIDNVVNDSFIHDMRLSADGSTLFSATEKLVRIFDLRTFQNIGKLNTGHKSLVTCLAVDNEDLNDTRIVITGSKDHFVKVFELDGEMSGIHTPKITLNPPHFDGIEALRLTGRGQYLFSGGRDGCIRKWDLTRHRMAASLSNCHRDWVLALNTLPQTSILLSACRSGYLRVWNTEDCSPFGEIQAHGSAINDIATIPQVAFTASSDCQIHVWQHRETAVNDDSA